MEVADEIAADIPADADIIANEVRGEVDIELDGQRYVLRPSHTAIKAMERKTAMPLVQLAALAEQCLLSQEAQEIVVTELVRAWGRELAVDEYATAAQKSVATSARAASPEAIGELLFSVGVIPVQARVAIVLKLAAAGGCLPSGEVKATEEETVTMTPETPSVADQE
jgi:hypothetical protein